MSQQQQIWDYLRENSITTKEDIINKLNIDKKAVVTYISALHKSNYLLFCIELKRARLTHSFKIIRNTGSKAPLLNKGILKDFNIKKEIKIAKEIKTSNSFNSQKNLKDILDSFLELNKEEVLISEVSKIFMLKKDLATNFGSTFLQRWIKKLESTNAIAFTGNTYRNSKIYLVNLQKIKEIRENIDTVMDYNLVL